MGAELGNFHVEKGSQIVPAHGRMEKVRIITLEGLTMKTLTYVFSITAGIWTVLYISPLVFITQDILQYVLEFIFQF